MRRLMIVLACVAGALLLAPSAFACQQSAYTECVPSGGSGGGASGGGGSSGGVAAATTSSAPSSSIPSSDSGYSGGSGSSSQTSAPSGGSQASQGGDGKVLRRDRGNLRSGMPHRPVKLSSSTGGGGGVPTIAWILIAVATACL